MLLLFGWMLIGSLYIVTGWFREGWRRRIPLSVYNAGLVLAVGMDFHALGMALTLFGRIEQILRNGMEFASDDPIYFAGVALILTGKTMFVWLASLGEGRAYSKTFWWSYWLCGAGWALFCWLR